MPKAVAIVIGTDPLKKRLIRGFIGGGVCLLLSAFGGGMSGGVGVLIPLIFFALFGTICGALTPMNILRSIGIVLMLMGGTIILGLTVDPMAKGQGFWFFGLGLATWWSTIRKLLNRKSE